MDRVLHVGVVFVVLLRADINKGGRFDAELGAFPEKSFGVFSSSFKSSLARFLCFFSFFPALGVGSWRSRLLRHRSRPFVGLANQLDVVCEVLELDAHAGLQVV